MNKLSKEELLNLNQFGLDAVLKTISDEAGTILAAESVLTAIQALLQAVSQQSQADLESQCQAVIDAITLLCVDNRVSDQPLYNPITVDTMKAIWTSLNEGDGQAMLISRINSFPSDFDRARRSK